MRRPHLRRSAAPFPHAGAMTACLSLLTCLWHPVAAQDRPAIDVSRYDLRIRLNLENDGWYTFMNSLEGDARITFLNASEEALDEIPVVLHRLMKVDGAADSEGQPLEVQQRIVPLEDREAYQANAASIRPGAPIGPGEMYTLQIRYSGGMTGYEETGMLYVRENLDPEFTIIRSETSAYPHLAEPSWEGITRFLVGGDGFHQRLEVDVPANLVVASGHELRERREEGDRTTWVYESRNPVFQIQIPVAPYEVLDVAGNRIYYFSEDEAGARRLATGIEGALELFASWLGPLEDRSSLAVVEIPDMYGSQALRPTILQTAPAFRDPSATVEMYHEISHLWNVEEVAPHPSRWNEGLAMYMQAAAAAELEDPGRFTGLLEGYVERLRSTLESRSEYRDVPLADAGERDATSAVSYSAGGIFFGLLHRRLGQARLMETFKDFLTRYRASGASTAEFAEFFLSRAPEARPIFDEWFSGSTYADLVLRGASFEELVERYEM